MDRAHGEQTEDAACPVHARRVDSPRGLLALQRSAGNAATVSALAAAHTVQREEGDYNAIPEALSYLGVAWLVQQAAEQALPNAVNVRCIRHYRAGTGAQLQLTATEVMSMAVNANVFNFRGVIAAQQPIVAEQARRLQAARDADPERVQAGSPCAMT